MSSMVHNALVETLNDAVKGARNGDEEWLATVCLDLLQAAPDHPAIVDVVNRTALRAIERKEEQDGTR